MDVLNFQKKYKFLRQFILFKREMATDKHRKFAVQWKDRLVKLDDNTGTSSFDAHYVYHTAWAARILRENSVLSHIDISSYIYFSAIVSAFIPVKFYDFRPAHINLSQFQSGKADLLNLDFESNSISSLSCMHVVEHIGLGRYGDKLEVDGDLKAMNELSRVMKPGGQLLFVVPVGKPAIRFNAHRIYDPEEVIIYFPELVLKEFSCVLDNGSFERNLKPSDSRNQNYACGMYHFMKKDNR